MYVCNSSIWPMQLSLKVLFKFINYFENHCQPSKWISRFQWDNCTSAIIIVANEKCLWFRLIKSHYYEIKKLEHLVAWFIYDHEQYNLKPLTSSLKCSIKTWYITWYKAWLRLAHDHLNFIFYLDILSHIVWIFCASVINEI